MVIRHQHNIFAVQVFEIMPSNKETNKINCKAYYHAHKEAAKAYNDKHIESRRKWRKEYAKKTQSIKRIQKFREQIFASDKRMTNAQHRVQGRVARGTWPKATTLECFYKTPICLGMAQEYDHYAGYDFENGLKVHPTCKPCHARIAHERNS